VLAQGPGLVCFLHHPTSEEAGGVPGQLTPADQRGTPYHMTSCSAYKAVGKNKEGGNIWDGAVCLPK